MIRKILGFLCICAIALLAENCRSLNPKLHSELEGESLDELKLVLASGFDSVEIKPAHMCLRDEHIEYKGAHGSNFMVLKDQNADDIINQVGGGLHAKASLFGLASAKVQGDMASTLATTDDSASVIYFFDIQGKQIEIKRKEFNDIGIEAFDRKDMLHFRKQCGNRYVVRANLGAQLFVGVKYTFASKEQKEHVRLKIDASLFWGLIKFSKTWTKEWKDMLANVRVSVDAFQIGGDRRALERVKDSTYQGTCQADNAERCSEAIEKLLEYGHSEFPEQLNDLAYTRDENKGLAIFDVETANYHSEPIFHPIIGNEVAVLLDPIEGPGDEVRSALSRVGELRRKINLALSRAKILRDFRLKDDEKIKIEIATRDLQGIFQTLDGKLEGICRAAHKEPKFLPECSSELGVITNKVEKAEKNLSIDLP